MSSRARENQRKNKQMGLYQIKNFCTAKETINKMKRKTTEWENIFINDTSNKVLISKIYKELIQVNAKYPPKTIQLKYGQKT